MPPPVGLAGSRRVPRRRAMRKMVAHASIASERHGICREAAACRPRLDSRGQARRLPRHGRRDDDGVRLLSRKGYNPAKRFRHIVVAVTVLGASECRDKPGV